LAIGAAFVPFQPFKYVVAIGATVGYIIYVHRHITDEEDYTPEELPSPLWCQPRAATPALVMVILQLVVSLALMIGGAKIFVDSITVTGDLLNIPTLVLALIIAPIATELPEKFNSVVWVRTKKDTLAMGNITGAMVFQSTIPVTIGMFFTNWHIDTSNLSGFVSGGIAILSCLTIFGLMAYRKRLTGPMLLFGGLWYIAYLAYLIFIAMPSGIPVSGAH
jgi:cation:H+ antiporter